MFFKRRCAVPRKIYPRGKEEEFIALILGNAIRVRKIGEGAKFCSADDRGGRRKYRGGIYKSYVISV